MAIEFRVHGKDSELVAAELAEQVKAKFGVPTTIRKPAPLPRAVGGASAEKVDPASAVILVLEIGIVAYHAWDVFLRQPYERAVAKWRELVAWAKGKLPSTRISAVIGDQDLPLGESDPERLQHLTKRALDRATITPE